MPLSDQERRILDEIERGIKGASSPAWASAVRLAVGVGRSWIAWVLAFIIGGVLLAAGVRTMSGFGTLAGVAGYLLVVFAIHQAVLAARGHLRGVGLRASPVDGDEQGEG